MPTAPLRACNVPGCAARCDPGRSRCRAHGSTRTTSRSPNTVYAAPRWKRLRAQVLAEEPICRICRTRPSEVADHILELLDGGAPFDRSNLQGACTACNVSKGQKAAQRRRARA